MPSNKKKPVILNKEQQDPLFVSLGSSSENLPAQATPVDVVGNIPITVGPPILQDEEEARESFKNSCQVIRSIVSKLPKEELEKLVAVHLRPVFVYQGYDSSFTTKE